MVKPTLYKGIEFVQLSSLPKADQEIFSKTFNQDALIKILINEEIIHDCIQYKDYLLWKNNLRAQENKQPLESAEKSVDSLAAALQDH